MDQAGQISIISRLSVVVVRFHLVSVATACPKKPNGPEAVCAACHPNGPIAERILAGFTETNAPVDAGLSCLVILFSSMIFALLTICWFLFHPLFLRVGRSTGLGQSTIPSLLS